MLLNCGFGEDSWESLGQQGDQTSQSEGLMLKLKLQYFGHLMWRVDSLQKTLMLGNIEDRWRTGTEDEMLGWHHWLNGHQFEQTLGDSEGEGGLVCYSSCSRKETWLSNWTTTIILQLIFKFSKHLCSIYYIPPLEKGMATHSSILAWRIPRTEEPGRLQSMGLQKVRQLTDFTLLYTRHYSCALRVKLNLIHVTSP